MLLAASGLLTFSQRAVAATTTYYVNSLTTNVTGNACTSDSLGGNCNLATALTRANALAGTEPVVIRPATGFAGGTIVQNCTAFMVTGLPQVANVVAAYYQLTRANTTIDLGNVISLSDNDCGVVAGLRIDAPNAVVRNVKDFYAGEAGFSIGPNGDNALLTALTLNNTATYNPEQAIIVMGGADGVTISNSSFSGYIGANAGGLGNGYFVLAVDPATPAAAVSNVTITNNTFTGGSTTTTSCGPTSGVGCLQRGITATTSATVSTLAITNNTFANFGAQGTGTNATFGAVDFFGDAQTGVTMSNLTVTGNTFSGARTGTGGLASVSLPYLRPLGGTNVIENNTFAAADNQQGSAVSWVSSRTGADNTAASNLTIRDNTMSRYGFGAPAIRLVNTGAVRVERNTLRNANAVLDVGATAETRTDFVPMTNTDTSSNRKIPTWFPAGTPTVTATAADGCRLNLTATRPTSSDATKLTYPLNLDVYWSPTGATGAEQYLGRVPVAASAVSTTISVPYPVGQAAGVVRLQTINGATPTESSQYSRVLAVPASSCPVALLSPTSGPTSGNTTVTITLLGAPAGSTLTGVTFGGTAGTSLSGSGTTYTVVTPARPAGTVTVVLSFSNGTTATLTGAYTYVPQPGLSVVKRAYSDAARTVELPRNSVVDRSSTVYWRYTVTNTGQAPLTDVAVTDDRLTPSAVCTIPTLAVGASTDCLASGPVN